MIDLDVHDSTAMQEERNDVWSLLMNCQQTVPELPSNFIQNAVNDSTTAVQMLLSDMGLRECVTERKPPFESYTP